MNDITRIRVGDDAAGIIGLKETLASVAEQCKGMPDDHVGDMLLERLSKRNYIDAGVRELYRQAFVREYKRFIGAPVAETPDGGINIKVLGPGCPRCVRLEQEVMAVLAEHNIDAELEHVSDPALIVRFGVMGTPALVIDGKVKIVGSIPTRGRIKVWLDQVADRKG